MRGIIAIVAAAMLAGCFSVEVAKSPVLGEDSVGHVVVSNYGWMLFGCIPLVCGNRNLDGWSPIAFFRDDITPDVSYESMMRLAEREGCKVRDVRLLTDNSVLFDAWYAPIPWILVYKQTAISGNLYRPEVSE